MHTEESWTKRELSNKHTFYILHCNILGEYIEFMQQCLEVTNKFNLIWDQPHQVICYKHKHQPDVSPYSKQLQQATKYYKEMQQSAYKFETQYHSMTQNVSHIQTNLDYWEQYFDTKMQAGKRALCNTLTFSNKA